MKNHQTLFRSGVILSAALLAAAITMQNPAVAGQQPASGNLPAAPKVTGPVANTSAPKDASHGYPYNTTPIDLKSAGYVEEEFFIEGTANRYAQPLPQRGGPEVPPPATTPVNATIQDSGHPFKTRIVVRRPATAARFNGAVIMEWVNVAQSHDEEVDWFESAQHFLRSGYAWVGVSAQPAGVDALKQWSAARYSTLNVTPPAPPAPQFGVGRGGPGAGVAPRGVGRGEGGRGEVEGQRGVPGERGGERGAAPAGLGPGPGPGPGLAGFGFGGQDIGYDIFTEAALAVRGKSNINVLGGFAVQQLIATGYLQSAGRLGTYFNTIHPMMPVFDGVLLHDGGGKLRTDLNLKVFKVLTESGVFEGRELANRQPDSDRLRTWEVAGTASLDPQIMRRRDELGLKPASTAVNEGCVHPILTHVPFHYVMAAAYDHLARWIKDGANPPAGTPFDVFDGPPEAPRRERSGQAIGGIQLAEYAVPVAINRGDNSAVETPGGNGGGFGFGFGPQTPVVGQNCNVLGWYEPYDAAKLASRYPTHDDYVKAVRDATEKNLKAGFIVKADADATIAEAEASTIGAKAR